MGSSPTEVAGQVQKIQEVEAKKADKRVAHVAMKMEGLALKMHFAALDVSQAISAGKELKGVFAGPAVSRVTDDIKELGQGGRGVGQRIWSVLLTVFSASALEVAQIIGENVPAAVPVLNGISIGAAGLSVCMAIDALVRECKIWKMFENLKKEMTRSSSDIEKCVILLPALKKLSGEDLDSLQVRCGFKGVNLQKKIDPLIQKLEKGEDMRPALKEAEEMTNVLAGRASENFGIKLAGLVVRVFVVVGMALLIYGADPVSKIVGTVLLCATALTLFILALKRSFFTNPNPFDPESKSLAQEAWASLIHWFKENIDPMLQKIGVIHAPLEAVSGYVVK